MLEKDKTFTKKIGNNTFVLKPLHYSDKAQLRLINNKLYAPIREELLKFHTDADLSTEEKQALREKIDKTDLDIEYFITPEITAKVQEIFAKYIVSVNEKPLDNFIMDDVTDAIFLLSEMITLSSLKEEEAKNSECSSSAV